MRSVGMVDDGFVHWGSKNKRRVAEKAAISIAFGLLGFAANFHTISFAFPPYTATVLLGLLFPMLIARSWGWKYGLLSALAGGCQSMWWLWGPSNGYATLFVVPPFTLWVVWHGLFAGLRRRQKTHRWWLSAYAVEVPFRILSTVSLYTLARWAIALNPPSWSWASGASSAVPMSFSHFVVLKQAVVAYVILLLVDVVLSLRVARRFFHLEEERDRADTGRVVGAALMLALLFWAVDSALGFLTFHSGDSFLDLLALDVPPYHLYVRTCFVLACLAGGLLALRLLQRQRGSDAALRESERRFKMLFEQAPIGYQLLDGDGRLAAVNDMWLHMLGCERREVIGRSFRDFLAPEAAEQFERNFRRLKETGSVRGSELEIVCKDGERRIVSTDGNAECDEGGVFRRTYCTLMDITERRQAEKALREKDAFLSSTGRMARVGGWEIDAATNVVSWTEETYRIHEVPVGEMPPPEDVINFFHPDDRGKMASAIQRALDHGEPYDMELRFTTAKGRHLWIHTACTPIVVDGKTVKLTGTFQDITELKRAQEERDRSLADSRERLKKMRCLYGVSESIREGSTLEAVFRDVVRLIPSGWRYPECARGRIRFGENEYVSEPFVETEWKESRDIVVDGEVRGSVEVFYIEDIKECSEGSFLEEESNLLEEIARALGGAAEHKRAERSLSRLAAAIEQAQEAVIVSDREGNIQYANRAFGRLIGRDPDEITGNILRLLDQDHMGEEFFTDLNDTLMSGESWQGRITGMKRDGQLYDTETTISPVLGGVGKMAGFVGVMRDVTEEANLRSQLQQAQKMEAVGQLAGGIAHDFNNILGAILGYAELASEGLPEDERRYRDLEQIRKAAEKAAALTRQLLAFSRRQIIEPEDADMNELIAGLLKMVRPIITESIALDFVPGHMLGTVHVDPTQIEQILMNLCVNARDAMPNGGTLTIGTENVVVNGEYREVHPWAVEGRYVLLTVSDTGHGMDAATRERIFEPFFTTKEVGKGSGLGLATVYGIVKQHGGLIHVYSEPDKGTAFKIYLPIVERRVGKTDGTVESPVPGGTETILVAEDDELVRGATVRILEGAGYGVIVATDGREAVELFNAHASEISLALLDVVMPKLGGQKVAARIREASPDLRIVYMSGYSIDAIHTKFVLDEGVSLLRKPFGPSDLLRRTREVLDAEP